MGNIQELSPRYDALRDALASHPLYDAIRDVAALRVFLEHHVYAVWDFMSLVKALQRHLAPARIPWTPPKNARHAQFINQLVLEEESDGANSQGVSGSHFEMYCQAMAQIGANVDPVVQFVGTVNRGGLRAAFERHDIPAPSRRFVAATFDIIDRDRPHLLAAALAYGREDVVPQLFRLLLARVALAAAEAPGLHRYLERHVELDQHQHGPMAVQLVQELCNGSAEKRSASIQVAEQAIAARLDLWDGIHAALAA